MSLFDSVESAWTALKCNLLRSILTTFGIIIGVASVIVLAAVGSGARHEVEERIAGLGSNMLVVFSGAHRINGRATGTGTERPLSEADLGAIREKVRGVVAVSGQLSGAGPIVYGNANWTSTLTGVHSEFSLVREWPVILGRDFTLSDVRGSAKVAILGQSVVDQLFAGADPIGAAIRVKNTPFEVVGVLGLKGSTSMGRDQDDVVLMPMTTARNQIVGKSQLTPDQAGQLYIKFEPDFDLPEAQLEIEQLLRSRRRIPTGGEDDFEVRNLAEFMKARNEVFSTMTYLLAVTSIVSLIVGGIGIMNVMLVAVTERTREIGLRMAVGGRRRDIMRQFLLEAIALCAMGGLIGCIVGITAAYGLANAVEWPIRISLDVIAIALSFAAATGILFGYVPARRAADLNPIEALRSD